MVYKAVCIITLLYGNEVYVTYRCHLKTLETFHQRCLRKMLHIRWKGRRTNDSVLIEANLTSIEAMIMQNQLRWTGHCVRMPDSRFPDKYYFPSWLMDWEPVVGREKDLKTLPNTTRRRVIITSTCGRTWLPTVYFSAAASPRQRPASRLTAYFTRRRSGRGERNGICLNTCTSSSHPEPPAPTAIINIRAPEVTQDPRPTPGRRHPRFEGLLMYIVACLPIWGFLSPFLWELCLAVTFSINHPRNPQILGWLCTLEPPF